MQHHLGEPGQKIPNRRHIKSIETDEGRTG